MKKKYKYYLLTYLYFLLQLSYFYLLNDIIFNSKKEKYYKLYVYINLLKIILPKIIKCIFLIKEKENIPTNFILSIEEIFKIWRDKWEIFDQKYFKGIFIYLFNFDSNSKIEKFYSKYIKDELDKYSIEIENLNLIEPQKIKILANEYGLDIDSNSSEIISNLKKIKKMELLMNLSQDLDGKEYNIISKIPQQETSKIQKILKKMENNYSINNTNNNNNEIEEDEKTIDKNNEVSNNKDNDFNDIDGEPL